MTKSQLDAKISVKYGMSAKIIAVHARVWLHQATRYPNGVCQSNGNILRNDKWNEFDFQLIDSSSKFCLFIKDVHSRIVQIIWFIGQIQDVIIDHGQNQIRQMYECKGRQHANAKSFAVQFDFVAELSVYDRWMLAYQNRTGTQIGFCQMKCINLLLMLTISDEFLAISNELFGISHLPNRDQIENCATNIGIKYVKSRSKIEHIFDFEQDKCTDRHEKLPQT